MQYEQSQGMSYYPSEGRIEEFPISADMISPRQDTDDSALVVKADEKAIEPTITRRILNAVHNDPRWLKEHS